MSEADEPDEGTPDESAPDETTPDETESDAPRPSWRRRWARRLGVLLLLASALWIPDCDGTLPEVPEGDPYAWNQDQVWRDLEERFRAARDNCQAVGITVSERAAALGETLDTLEARPALSPDDPALQAYEEVFFQTAADAAACPVNAELLLGLHTRLRRIVKAASARWDFAADRNARARLYRVLYGGRMAIEEVLLQMPPADVPALALGTDVPSDAPSVEIRGVRVHSGDVLISRGGAPTSAFIARGNDWPGNFSHIALVHVDEEGGARTIEAHIERGVVVAGPEKYLGDPKLRILVLRARPELVEGGALAHAAATHALEDARSRHIAYDFAMDYDDPGQMFCSEVASAAYRTQGIALWQNLTSTSDEAAARWLGRFGVEELTTHGPSDLEYDPQMAVVAEWRDPETLFQSHLDDAILDAMLAGAADGDEVEYFWPMLGVARILKAYSAIKVYFGGIGPIPEGMSATVALRVQWLRERHAAIREGLLTRIADYEEEHGHRPPFWELRRLAVRAERAL